MYQHILFATDFSEDALRVGERARDIARQCGARLSLLHVVEDVTISLGGGYELLPVLPDLPDEALLQEARSALGELARRLEVVDADLWVVNAISTKEGILWALIQGSPDRSDRRGQPWPPRTGFVTWLNRQRRSASCAVTCWRSAFDGPSLPNRDYRSPLPFFSGCGLGATSTDTFMACLPPPVTTPRNGATSP